MKSKLILAAVLVLASLGCSASTLQFKFDYDYTYDPPCTVTVTTNCVSGFQMLDGSTVIGTITSSPTASGAVSGITGTAHSSAYGNHSYSVTAIGIGADGKQYISAPLSVTVTVVPTSPKNGNGSNQ